MGNFHRFADSVVVVTGAASGIGAGIVQRFMDEGARVAGLDLNPSKVAFSSSDRFLALPADVTSEASLTQAALRVRDQLGNARILVNCAGMVTMHGLEDLSVMDWDRVLDVNLKGPLLAVQAFLDQMKIADGQQRSVVNITSVESDRIVASGPACQPHYSASKGGLLNLNRAMAHELGRYGIRVNAVAPGPVATEFAGIDYSTPEAQEFLKRFMVIPKPNTPAQIAAAVAFLCSDDADGITGIELPVDGGWRVH